MVIRFGLFLKELLLFGPTMMVGIYTAHKYSFILKKPVSPITFSFDDIIYFALFFLVVVFLMKRFRRFNVLVFRFFLFLIIFTGSQLVFGAFLPLPTNILLAILLVALFILIHNILIHDLAIIVGIAGIASALGISISPIIAIILLVAFSFYDILAVYWTKHMIRLAKGMVESGAIMGFVIPFQIKDFFFHKSASRDKLGEKFMILGSGDIGLPVILLSSVAFISVWQSLIISVFVVLGLFLTHFIFVNQKERKPMAALPPIATMTIVGYLVSQLL